MASKTLSRNDLAFGRAVLLATDSLGMSVEGAFWLHDDEDRCWRYFLVTSLFDKIQPRTMFQKLNKILTEKLSESETREFSFYIATPNDRFVRVIREQIQTSIQASLPHEITVHINHHKARVYVYRMASKNTESQISKSKRRFDRLYKEVVAA